LLLQWWCSLRIVFVTVRSYGRTHGSDRVGDDETALCCCSCRQSPYGKHPVVGHDHTPGSGRTAFDSDETVKVLFIFPLVLSISWVALTSRRNPLSPKEGPAVVGGWKDGRTVLRHGVQVSTVVLQFRLTSPRPGHREVRPRRGRRVY
jgi:hypothetical protein